MARYIFLLYLKSKFFLVLVLVSGYEDDKDDGYEFTYTGKKKIVNFNFQQLRVSRDFLHLILKVK